MKVHPYRNTIPLLVIGIENLIMLRHCLRVFALILIVLPEPITTALGIAMLAVLLKIGRGTHLNQFANMEELVKRSLKRIESDSSSPWTSLKKTAVFHELNRPGNDTGAITQANYPTGTWFDNRRISGKILHHTLQNSIVQYQVKPAVLKTSGPGAKNLDPEQSIALHTLKANDLSRPAGNSRTPAADGWKKQFFTPDEVVFHALKTS
jgi:hypothetical protein